MTQRAGYLSNTLRTLTHANPSRHHIDSAFGDGSGGTTFPGGARG